jgi:TPR repeat protein
MLVSVPLCLRLSALWLVAAIPVTCLAGIASVGQTATPRAHGQVVDLTATPCPEGEERFLPGDYYFCRATRYYGEGRYGSAQNAFELAAEWGSKPAQHILGLMHFNGDHTAVDKPLGIAWLALAAERPNPGYLAILQSAWGKATVAEQARARKLLAQMRATYADRIAAVRAKRRYDRAMREFRRNDVFGVRTCLRGFTSIEPLPKDDRERPPGCFSTASIASHLEQLAGDYFEGWEGVVHVGPLVPIKSHSGAGD